MAKGALAQTAKELVDAVVDVVKTDDRMLKTMTYKSGSGTYKAADKEKQAQWMSWVEQRRSVMEKEVLAGLVVGRKRIIATMTAGRFSSSGKRATKKSIKAEAALAAPARCRPQPDRLLRKAQVPGEMARETLTARAGQ